MSKCHQNCCQTCQFKLWGPTSMQDTAFHQSACRCVHADKLINVDACTIMYLNNLISMDRYRSVYIETVKATSTFYHCRIHTKFVPSSCIVCPRDVDSMCQDAVPQEFAAEFLQRGVAAVPRFSPSEYF